jgi:hypothetical protein
LLVPKAQLVRMVLQALLDLPARKVCGDRPVTMALLVLPALLVQTALRALLVRMALKALPVLRVRRVRRVLRAQ